MKKLSLRRRRQLGAVAAVAALAVVGCTSSAVGSGSGSNSTAVAAGTDNGPHRTANNPPEPQSVYGDNNATIAIPDGSCVYTQFDGQDHNKGRAVLFAGMPGTDLHYGSGIKLWQIPGCASTRDFIEGSSLIQNALGEGVFDRKQPAPGDSPAYTKNHTPVWVAMRVDWVMNLSEQSLTAFWREIITKFNAATPVDDPNNPPTLGRTSSKPEWLRWQGEDIGFALDALVTNLMNNYGDDVITNAGMQADLAHKISLGFANTFANFTQTNLPLICGPNSFWKDKQTDNFICSPVKVWDLHVIPDSQMPYGLGPSLAHQVAACKFLGTQCNWNAGAGGVTIKTKAARSGKQGHYATAA